MKRTHPHDCVGILLGRMYQFQIAYKSRKMSWIWLRKCLQFKENVHSHLHYGTFCKIAITNASPTDNIGEVLAHLACNSRYPDCWKCFTNFTESKRKKWSFAFPNIWVQGTQVIDPRGYVDKSTWSTSNMPNGTNTTLVQIVQYNWRVRVLLVLRDNSKSARLTVVVSLNDCLQCMPCTQQCMACIRNGLKQLTLTWLWIGQCQQGVCSILRSHALVSTVLKLDQLALRNPRNNKLHDAELSMLYRTIVHEEIVVASFSELV